MEELESHRPLTASRPCTFTEKDPGPVRLAADGLGWLGAGRAMHHMHDKADVHIRGKRCAAAQNTVHSPRGFQAQPSKMVLNVIEPAQARYIALRDELEVFLRGKFGTNHDFNIEVGV